MRNGCKVNVRGRHLLIDAKEGGEEEEKKNGIGARITSDKCIHKRR